ncbi:phage tail protein [Vibrio coralliilyticus]|nr:phage tail protein [Vibrio coralliilyticus]
MAWPTVTIIIQNLMQGPIATVDNHFLFVGYGTVTGEERPLYMVDSTSDLDEVLDKASAEYLANLKASQLNAKQNWTAGVLILDQGDNWQDAVKKANEVSSFEATAIHIPATNKAFIESAITLRTELKASLGRETFVICRLDKPNAQSWEEYVAVCAAITNDIASEYVTVIPTLHKDLDTFGKGVGRMANGEVSIADSPARVMTGSVVGNSEFLTDKNGDSLQLAHLRTLETNRLSVPMWYPDYPGQYWTTGNTLDVPGGDYQDIRHIRVAMKAARFVRIRAIARIADRKFNSTPAATEAAKIYFTQDLRRMARTGDPGEILPPEEGDIRIKWVTNEEVEIAMQVQPYDCPVKITVYITVKKGEVA